MASNSFGYIFRITTWGESHGKAIGVTVDGCPAGLCLTEEEIRQALARRAPGHTLYTSPRRETERAEILSGVWEGKTTGAPIAILIPNEDADSSAYAPIKQLLRPGHAGYSYLEKYGCFDPRGGGRASARETACRVAAGAIAQKILQSNAIRITAYLMQMGDITAQFKQGEAEVDSWAHASQLFCPDKEARQAMIALLEELREEGDSIGGIVEFCAEGVPAGLGDPIYEKLEANIAHALMTIPASKGVEIGMGFRSVSLRGSEHNDLYSCENGNICLQSNRTGGILGGISTGNPIVGRVAFKPTSSIRKVQNTVTVTGEHAVLTLPPNARHDPCVAIRAVPVVEAMLSLVLVDALLMNRCVR